MVDVDTFEIFRPEDLVRRLECEHGLLVEAGEPSSHTLEGAVGLSLSSLDTAEYDSEGLPRRIRGNFSLQSDEKLRVSLEAAGITRDRFTVVFTRAHRAGGVDLTAAARLAWILAYAGVRRLALLTGTFASWKAAGLKIGASSNGVRQDFFGGARHTFPVHPEYLASTEEVASVVSGQAWARLADVRAWCEYTGDGDDYPYPMPRGRIPGALWARWGPSTYIGGDLHNHEAGTPHGVAETCAMWSKRLGVDLTQDVIFYCGTGWRSALAWCIARACGYSKCANYDGGIFEWSLEDGPLDTGPSL